MAKILVGIVFGLVCFIGIKHYYTLEKNKKILLTSNGVISLRTVTIFSLYELVNRLKRYYRKAGAVVLIEYADGKYVDINTKESKLSMFNRLVEAQGITFEEELGYDYITSIMYELWLRHACKRNYKKLFWNEVNRMHQMGEVSISLYNEIYRRFYKYKFLNPNNY